LEPKNILFVTGDWGKAVLEVVVFHGTFEDVVRVALFGLGRTEVNPKPPPLVRFTKATALERS